MAEQLDLPLRGRRLVRSPAVSDRARATRRVEAGRSRSSARRSTSVLFNRPGARFSPQAIRATAYEPHLPHGSGPGDLRDWLEVVDFGDAYARIGQTEVSHANIKGASARSPAAGIVPVILGGDHSITWPAATAVADFHGYGNVGIVHLTPTPTPPTRSRATWPATAPLMRRLIESGRPCPAATSAQVGYRRLLAAPGHLRVDARAEMTWHTMQEIQQPRLQGRDGPGCQRGVGQPTSSYVNGDIDVLDPAHAPGTGIARARRHHQRRPAPDGPPTVLRARRRRGDVVEVAPACDHAELTVNAAHRVVFEALAGMAARRRDTARSPNPVRPPAGEVARFGTQ